MTPVQRKIIRTERKCSLKYKLLCAVMLGAGLGLAYAGNAIWGAV